MQTKMKIKTGIDLLMTVLLLLLMAYQITGQALHEWFGAGLLRVIQTAVNFGALITMLCLGFSGIVMSRHVFAALSIHGPMATARMMHLAASCLGFPKTENWRLKDEAQRDQNEQARPELANHVEDMDEYDFTGKTIIPFCSHGGGRFGQSLTAIAKLAPDAVMGETLSVHYSGGSSLSGDVEEWLRTNGMIE